MNWANTITIIRILIIPGFIISLVNYIGGNDTYRIFAVVLFSVASLSDFLDGFVAKVFNQETELGRFLDPVADKMLLISAFVMLVVVKLIPVWVAIVVITRDVIILFGCIIIYLILDDIEIKPRILSKITTFIQMVTIFFVLVRNPFARYLWFATAIVTTISGLDYIISSTINVGEKAKL
ncbi:MAG: CDP-alcohol phosphatidyltransferase family protein [bacterium]|nr:CDP-alcohol phosphatidyltransferase family protein [bacterium]